VDSLSGISSNSFSACIRPHFTCIKQNPVHHEQIWLKPTLIIYSETRKSANKPPCSTYAQLYYNYIENPRDCIISVYNARLFQKDGIHGFTGCILCLTKLKYVLRVAIAILSYYWCLKLSGTFLCLTTML